MITIETDLHNPLSQDFYNQMVFSLDLAVLPCPCGHTGSLIWYGSYTRKVTLPDRTISLRVSRVLCQYCGHSHAIMPSSLVPYSRFPLELHAAVASCCESGSGFRDILKRHFVLDEANLACLARSFRLHWRERLRSIPFHPSLPELASLVRACFDAFSRQFMQIKTTINKLFLVPT